MDITMPQLGETVTEGTVTRWLKAVGDQVAPDELIFEVDEDRAREEDRKTGIIRERRPVQGGLGVGGQPVSEGGPGLPPPR